MGVATYLQRPTLDFVYGVGLGVVGGNGGGRADERSEGSGMGGERSSCGLGRSLLFCTSPFGSREVTQQARAVQSPCSGDRRKVTRSSNHQPGTLRAVAESQEPVTCVLETETLPWPILRGYQVSRRECEWKIIMEIGMN